MEDLILQMGKRIVSRRKQLRLTQEELAEKAGITPQTISSAELGKKAMRPENIVKVSEVLGVSTDYLLLGKITCVDKAILTNRISTLTVGQYHHLEDIVNSFVDTVNEREA